MDLKPDDQVLIRLSGVSLYIPFRGAPPKPAQGGTPVGGEVSQERGAHHVVALRDVNITIRKGERVAIVGHNGAGKSSLLRVMSGIYSTSVGRCEINAKVTPLLSSTIGLNVRETGRQNTALACAMFGVPSSEVPGVIEKVAEFSELGEFLDLPVATYSHGMRVRLGFSIVTSMRPDVLVLDEVLSTGDRAFSVKAQARIVELVEQAHAVVMSAHSVGLLRMICTRAIWMEHGKVRMDGPLEAVWKDYSTAVAKDKKKK